MYYRTQKGLDIDGTLSRRTRSIDLGVSPIGPHSQILQGLIESTILKVAS